MRRQAEKAGIGMPEVAIYDAPEINAFATGWNRNNSLVAVCTGLLNNMSRDEAEAVLGHECRHVANGDMVTMTLIQGVLNTFVIFLSRVVGFVVDRVLLKSERGYGLGYFVTIMVAELVFGLFAAMIVAWFSRQREFRADAGGADARRPRQDDRRAGAAEVEPGAGHRCRSRSRPSAFPAGGGFMALMHVPSAARRAHRRAA